jgi:putative ABC transport system permease protein
MTLIRSMLSLLTLLIQSALLALSQIWANKTRSFLTTIGIVIGVASVSAVVACLTGLKAEFYSVFETLGTNKMFINPDYRGAIKRNPRGYFYGLHVRDFDGLLEHCPSVKALTRQTEDTVTANYASKSEDDVRVVAVEPSWHEVENRTVIVGRPFSLIDEEHNRPVVLINPRLRERLGLPQDPTGLWIALGKIRYRVIGVLEPRTESSMFSFGSGMEAYVPFSTLYGSRERAGIEVVAVFRSPDLADEAQAEIAFFLRHKRRIPVGEPDDFRIDVVEQVLAQFRTIAAATTAIATCVVGISLLVGGVGIMNIMLVSVSERTREIGLRKAVGARPSAILLQFLVEATMLCLMGGLIGLIIAQIIVSAASRIPAIHLGKAYIPAWAVVLSFGFAAGVGLIFGMFPAIKAARLDPIEALRHE